MITFDGLTVKMYINAQLHKSWSHPYALNASTKQGLPRNVLARRLRRNDVVEPSLSGQEVTETLLFSP